MSKGKWDADTVERVGVRYNHNLRHIKTFAGLFVYSGFGMGTYYSKTGETHWTWRRAAEATAKEEGVDFVYIDSFEGYSADKRIIFID